MNATTATTAAAWSPAAVFRVLLALALGTSVALAQPGKPAATAPDTPAGAALTRLIEWINGEDFDQPETFFDEAFLNAIPPAQLGVVRAQLVQQYFGPGEVSLVRIEQQLSPHELDAVIVGSKGAHMRTRLGLDMASGLMNRLNFAPAPELDDTSPKSWADLIAALEALPGTITFGAYELTADSDDEDSLADLRAVATHNPVRALAIGSAFKLYVLGAVGEAVAAGDHKWLDTVAVDDDIKSLPSGKMQLLPAGTALTLDAVATDMIRISDNTATDHLIHLLGRAAVEAYTLEHDPSADAWFPFLTTLDMFRLKLSGDDALMTRYAEADLAERRRLLAEDGPVDQLTPNMLAATMWRAPREIERLEWFASARTLAALHARLGALAQADRKIAAALRQNPGLPFARNTWPDIAFKGGSEPGVICFAWLMERNDGRQFALVMAWNDPAEPVDESAAMDLALIAATLLAEE